MIMLNNDQKNALVTVVFVVVATILFFIFITMKDERAIKEYNNIVIQNEVYETNVLVADVDETESCILFTYESRDIYNYNNSIYEKCKDMEGKKVPCYLRVVVTGDGEVTYSIDDVRL